MSALHLNADIDRRIRQRRECTNECIWTLADIPPAGFFDKIFTRDFLPYCKTHLDSCDAEIATIIISNAAVSQKTFCVPQSALVSEATYTASQRRDRFL